MERGVGWPSMSSVPYQDGTPATRNTTLVRVSCFRRTSSYRSYSTSFPGKFRPVSFIQLTRFIQFSVLRLAMTCQRSEDLIRFLDFFLSLAHNPQISTAPPVQWSKTLSIPSWRVLRPVSATQICAQTQCVNI